MNQAMIEEYLAFLKCQDAREVCRENLFRLQLAHLQTLPYSNLTIFTDGEPDLSESALFDRLIRQKRGGYCFELNGLFGYLLRDLGYDVTEYFGRWHFGLDDEIAPQRHRVLSVKCGDGTFIVDAGVASPAPGTPLEAVFDKIQHRSGRSYRLRADETYGTVVETLTGSEWKAFYSFNSVPAFARDFEYVNYFCSTHHSSVFRKKFFAAKQDADQHVCIENPTDETPFFQLAVRTVDGKNCTPVETPEALQEILQDRFGMIIKPEMFSVLQKIISRQN